MIRRPFVFGAVGAVRTRRRLTGPRSKRPNQPSSLAAGDVLELALVEPQAAAARAFVDRDVVVRPLDELRAAARTVHRPPSWARSTRSRLLLAAASRELAVAPGEELVLARPSRRRAACRRTGPSRHPPSISLLSCHRPVDCLRGPCRVLAGRPHGCRGAARSSAHASGCGAAAFVLTIDALDRYSRSTLTYKGTP